MSEPFIEIEAKSKNARAVYRFYGRGRWAVQCGHEWKVISSIFIPFNVLHTAASHCHAAPPPTGSDQESGG